MSVISNLHDIATIATVLILLSFTACTPLPTLTPLTTERVLVSAAKTDTCEACDQATRAAAMVQNQNASDIQAVATAEILLANAQATLNSANATLAAVQTQEQSNADAIAAEIEAIAKLAQANAKATLVAAGSTQSAALTQDSIQQTQVQYSLLVDADMATQNALADARQQQIEQQKLVPITFLWMWCFPIFAMLLAGLVLWGIWRKLTIQQTDLLPFQDNHANRRSWFDRSEDDQALRWLDDVRRKLLGISTYKKDDYL